MAARDAHAAEIEWRRALWPDIKSRLLKPDYRVSMPDIDPLRLEPESLGDCQNLLERRLQFEFRRRLGDGMLVMEEKMAMAHGLELRMPFLDRSVVEFALSLPANMKRRGRQEKYLLSRVARKRLPPSIAGRRKHGFRAIINRRSRDFMRGRLLDDADPQPFDREMLERSFSPTPSPADLPPRYLHMLFETRCWWKEFFENSRKA